MRLDAMLGKTTVGPEKKIEEPTIQQLKDNVERLKYIKHSRKPYEIPASTLMKHNKK